MSTPDRTGQPELDVEAAATWLHEVGLAGPAYLLFQSMRPLAFLGGQGLLFLQPLLPVGRWRAAVGRFAELLDNRTQMDALVASLEARLRGPKNAPGKEKA